MEKQLSIDLFKVIVEDNKLHPLFKQVLTNPDCVKTHPIINSWCEGLFERSGESLKFVKEFQTTFSSSFWELYLNQAFKELGYEIDYSKASPDFNLVREGGGFISVEAVTSNPQEQRDLIAKELSDKQFLDASTLKLAGKIRDKHKLYIGDDKKKYPYCSLEHVKGNPFVLAVAPFERCFAQSQNNTAINRVLYGLEPPLDYRTPQETVEYIQNKNGKEVELGLFTGDSYKEISAVIFSTTGTFSKAVVRAGTANFIRATKLRKIGIVEFMAKEGIEKIGISRSEVSDGGTVLSERSFYGFDVCGYDMYICNAHYHNETHLDGLQIYHNPYALHPLTKEDFNSYEIVHYRYDIESRQMLIDYRDGALVSRNTVTEIGQ